MTINQVKVRRFWMRDRYYYKYRLPGTKIDLKVSDIEVMERIKFVFSKTMSDENIMEVEERWRSKLLQ